MKRVIFKNQEDQNVFVVTDLTNYIIPKKGERITWSGIYMFVTAVEHDYDAKEIIVEVEIK